jgi:hypothetical protein
MIRLQQYERQMKAILAHHEIAGPVDELEAQRLTSVGKFSGKSLGQLAKSLFETYVVPEGFQRGELLPDEGVPVDRMAMAFRFSISMSEERWRETKAAVEELVKLRNDLVHHLIERFDVWTDEGCVEAVEHLSQCYERIDLRFKELFEWAKAMDVAKGNFAAYAQTQEFQDAIVNGISPDGSFDWAHTGIVRVLREAALALGIDGWTNLGSAQAWVADGHPEQTPAKYGCRTWPQVLSESRQFDLHYKPDEAGQRVAWYRPRESGATAPLQSKPAPP